MGHLVTFKQQGDFKETKKFFFFVQDIDLTPILQKYAQMGVDALRSATPKDTGKTSQSWYYRIEHQKNSYTIEWFNSNTIKDGSSIALLLQYGHGTGNGGYVCGRDYINPVMQPIFDQIADEAYKEVTGS